MNSEITNMKSVCTTTSEVLLTETNGRYARETWYLNEVANGSVDGILFS